MIKTRNKKTGAINYKPTSEDKSRFRLTNRVSYLEKKVSYLEEELKKLKELTSFLLNRES